MEISTLGFIVFNRLTYVMTVICVYEVSHEIKTQ